MPKFRSIQMTPPLSPVSGPGIGGRTLHTVRGFVDFATTGTMAIADTIDFLTLPRNFRVHSIFFKSTGAAASCTVALGDSGAVARYMAATAVTAAGTSVVLAETGRDYVTPTNTIVVGTIAGAATGAVGTLTVVVTGVIEEPA